MEITSWETGAQQASPDVPQTEKPSETTSSAVVKRDSVKDKDTGLYPFVEDHSRFDASVKGLSDARTAIRRQMARIVNEVDKIEKDPKLATDEDHREPFQSPVVFECRLPEVIVPEKLQQTAEPLTGQRIMAKTQKEDEQKAAVEKQSELQKKPSLYTTDDKITVEEKSLFDKIKDARPDIGEYFRVSGGVGSEAEGTPFNNLDFLHADWVVRSVSVEIAEGAVVSVALSYQNGLQLRKGSVSGYP